MDDDTLMKFFEGMDIKPIPIERRVRVYDPVFTPYAWRLDPLQHAGFGGITRQIVPEFALEARKTKHP